MLTFFFFDLGKVLLDFDHTRMLRQMAEVAGVSVEAMRAAIMPTGAPTRGDAQWRLEAGEISEEAYYEGLCERLGVRPDRAKLTRASCDIFTPIEESMRLVERMHAAGHRQGLLSNTSPAHWEFFLDGRYPTLNRALSVRVGSFHTGSMKPDAVVYRYAAERAGVAPEEVFFTDDRADNVEGARRFGFDAVVFTGAAALEAELRERGVLF